MASSDKPEDVKTAVLGLFVELLAARQGANAVRDELTPLVRKVVDPFGVWSDLASGVTSADVRTLAYDVARIQINALTELTKQSEALSRRVAQRLKDVKRPVTTPPGCDPERLLVCNLQRDTDAGGPYRGSFVAPGRIGSLPQALVLRPLDGGFEFPVTAAFSRDAAPSNGETVRVSIEPDPFIERGKRHQARLPLAGTDTVVVFKLVG